MKIIVKILTVLIIAILAVVGLVAAKFSADSTKIYQAQSFQIHDLVQTADKELGKRIFMVRNGCVDCHGEDLAGQLVMDNGAMGTIRGANLTPANLKDWTDEEVARAIRYGIHKTGRSLRFMPSFDFENLSQGDIAAVVAYIRSVPEVPRSSAENSFGPVARTLSMLGKMPVMFPAKVMDLNKGFAAKPPEGPTVEFGKYLANSCVGCHGAEYLGGKIPGGDPAWPEAANIRLGLNPSWSEEKFNELLKTGISPITHQSLRPPMPIKLLAQMNPDEVKALWLYLSTLK